MYRSLRRALVAFSATALTTALSTALPVGPASAAPAPNDDIGAATVVTALPFTGAVDTREATTAADDPEACPGRNRSVWYAYTPADSGRVIADTFGSNYDTVLSVYTGVRGALHRVGCNDDSDSLLSRVEVPVSGGTTYWFMATAYDDRGGDLVLNVRMLEPPRGIGNSQGDGSQDSECGPRTGVTGLRAGVMEFSWGTVVGSVSALCGPDGTTAAASIGDVRQFPRQYSADSTCPDGQYVVGIAGAGGDLVDAVRVLCRAVDRDDRPVGTMTTGAPVGGSGGAPQGPFLCREGDVVLGLAGTFRPGNEDVLDYVEPLCGALHRPYAFTGFYAPVSSTGSTDAQAGRVVPLKWHLLEPEGDPVVDPDSFRALSSAPTAAACSGGASAEPVPEGAAGSSGLQYLGDGTWQFNWTTSRAYAGQCRTVTLTLRDGSTHSADFRFR